jgi:L-iditol 2-dehydrogenase
MHAAIFYGPNHITNEDFYYNNDTSGGVSVKVNACAVCGYDVRVFRYGHRKVKPPVILGHEICGEIDDDVAVCSIASNRDTQILKAGSRVVISPQIPCLKCIYCDTKQYNLCSSLKEIGSNINGGFAENLRIPKNIPDIGGIVPAPDCVSNEEAALLESLACCLNGFSQIGPISERDSVVIIGDGPIGLLHLQLSRNLYHARTAVVGKISQRIRKARSLGADATTIMDNHEEHVATSITKILEFTDGIGANVIIIVTSDPAAFDFAFEQSLQTVD